MKLHAGIMVAGLLVAMGTVSGEEAGPVALQLSGEFVGTHDPSIAVEQGRYYVFATGRAYAGAPAESPAGARGPGTGQLPIRCSDDLRTWRRCGQVFPAIPAWITQLSPGTRDLWAPDISYFDGLYHLYYAFSIFGRNTSGIALATNQTLDAESANYHWVDRGLVLQSRAGDNFNAIDPSLILGQKGQAWLMYGSFWTGIKLRRLDRATGLLSEEDTRVYSLASRGAGGRERGADPPPGSEAIEAPFLFEHGKYYYLFVSWDLCCRGSKSTYRTMVGRSKKITGPYRDRDGKRMLEGGGTPLLVGNGTWLGPGGESLLHLDEHLDSPLAGQDSLVFHAYGAVDGRPALQISTIAWKKGWPLAALGDKAP
ncbi:MAG TPA: arabinan endo-1,5-alpha-L-arabinosidase [Acidobacteriaceae bacterium]